MTSRSAGRRLAAFLMAVAMTAMPRAWAIGFDSDDFLIAGSGSWTISVYDHDFTFKGHLETGYFGVHGLVFDNEGDLVTVSDTVKEVRSYDANGQRIGEKSFFDPSLGRPIDIAIGPNGNYYLPKLVDFSIGLVDGITEYTPEGVEVRTVGSRPYAGVAVTPAGTIWAGRFNSPWVDILDLNSGQVLDSIQLGSFPDNPNQLSYSAATDTVLVTQLSRVTEWDLQGRLIREFNEGVNFNGVTRGPDAMVIATAGLERSPSVHRWTANGQYLGMIPLDTQQTSSPYGIVWAGSISTIPEPTTLALILFAGVISVGECSRCR